MRRIEAVKKMSMYLKEAMYGNSFEDRLYNIMSEDILEFIEKEIGMVPIYKKLKDVSIDKKTLNVIAHYDNIYEWEKESDITSPDDIISHADKSAENNAEIIKDTTCTFNELASDSTFNSKKSSCI